MRHHDLTTLIRDHVTRDEPGPLDVGRAVGRGRRRLRTRRAAATGATVAAIAVAAVVASSVVGGDAGRGSRSAIDPASQRALDTYDAARMPRILDEHVRPVLERSTPDLGPVTFRAVDDQARELPPDLWDRASGLSVVYGSAAHRFHVALSHSPSEAEGDPQTYCASGLEGGYDLACTVDTDADGAVVIRSLYAVKALTGPPDGSMIVVRAQRLDDVDLARLSFRREVKVIKSASLVTYADETVKATDRDPAAAVFSASYDDLVAIGTDPALVMPKPPPGANGCPAYSMPVKGRTDSCS